MSPVRCEPLETPPLARGRLHHLNLRCTSDRNTPACAGKTGTGNPSVGITIETPPLARGRRARLKALMLPAGNTPACAGKTADRVRNVGSSWKHPRLRGEDIAEAASDSCARETPPLARGRQRRYVRARHVQGNTPACAGKTEGIDNVAGALRKHPRLRGEDCTGIPDERKDEETPPLARGRHARRNAKLQRGGNTPACAGKTLTI